MTIAFVHSHHAFLPERTAYARFFLSLGANTIFIGPEEADSVQADLLWFFMGSDVGSRADSIPRIHEYGSASVPPFRQMKDLAKKMIAPKPVYRIFLNEYVQKQFAFNDGLPFGFRDMGVDLSQPIQTVTKEFDFIYTGSVQTHRGMERLLNHFAGVLRNHTLLVLSQDYMVLQTKFSSASNILFRGPVDHGQVPGFLAAARFAINFIPDREPFNQQTSTKFLEYAAAKLPVISTDYPWIRQFQEQWGGQYFYLDESLANFTWENLQGYEFAAPDLQAWTWEKQISHSGILEFLKSKGFF